MAIGARDERAAGDVTTQVQDEAAGTEFVDLPEPPVAAAPLLTSALLASLLRLPLFLTGLLVRGLGGAAPARPRALLAPGVVVCSAVAVSTAGRHGPMVAAASCDGRYARLP